MSLLSVRVDTSQYGKLLYPGLVQLINKELDKMFAEEAEKLKKRADDIVHECFRTACQFTVDRLEAVEQMEDRTVILRLNINNQLTDEFRTGSPDK